MKNVSVDGSGLLDIRALRYFNAVYEFANYSRAAEYLHITQPAVSRQISLLEHELDQELFDRTGHGVVPSEAGHLLYERSKAILRQVNDTYDVMRAMRDELSGQLVFAVPPASAFYLVPPLVKRMRNEYPGIVLKVVAGYGGHVLEMLKRGQIDYACLYGAPTHRGFDTYPLIEEEVFLIGPKDDPVIQRTSIELADLNGLPLILPSHPNNTRRLIELWLSSVGLLPNVSMEADDLQIAKLLIDAGFGYSLLCRGAVEDEVRQEILGVVPLRPSCYWPLALTVSSNRVRGPIDDIFTAAVYATVRDLVTNNRWSAKLLQGRSA